MGKNMPHSSKEVLRGTNRKDRNLGMPGINDSIPSMIPYVARAPDISVSTTALKVTNGHAGGVAMVGGKVYATPDMETFRLINTNGGSKRQTYENYYRVRTAGVDNVDRISRRLNDTHCT